MSRIMKNNSQYKITVAAKLFYPKATELACPGIAGYNDHINTERKRASPS
jgi:hypothetical protein